MSPTADQDGFFEIPNTTLQDKIDSIQEEGRKASLLKRIKDLEQEILNAEDEDSLDEDKESMKKRLLKG